MGRLTGARNGSLGCIFSRALVTLLLTLIPLSPGIVAAQYQGSVSQDDVQWYFDRDMPAPWPGRIVFMPKARYVKQMKSVGPDVCLPPNPDWTLVAENATHCWYEVPRQAGAGESAWTVPGGVAACRDQGGGSLFCEVRKLLGPLQMAIETWRIFRPPGGGSGGGTPALPGCGTFQGQVFCPGGTETIGAPPAGPPGDRPPGTSGPGGQPGGGGLPGRGPGGGGSNGDGGRRPPGGRPGGTPEGANPIADCVDAAEDARARLSQIAREIQPLWDRNVRATGSFFSTIARMAWDDLAGLAEAGVSTFDRYRRDPVATGRRDVHAGILGVQSKVGEYIADPMKLAELDPVPPIQAEINRFQALLKRDPGAAAGQAVYIGQSLIPGRLPSCPVLSGGVAATRRATAMKRAEQVAVGLKGGAQRSQQFGDAWGNRRKTGTWGTNGGRAENVAARGSAHNPQCGEFNCFAVSIAKTRSLATGRPYQARAIRPGEAADVPMPTREVEDILHQTYGQRGVRNPSLYTPQELQDHVRGLPSSMPVRRIEDILQRSGPGSQGLVFVDVPAANPTTPGELVGHVFNVHNDNGVIRFVDEQGATGAMDGRFWFLEARNIYFYEVR